jgi:formyltetrahydrofolate-dependent phosphoribosylglycinamide formyltransferase
MTIQKKQNPSIKNKKIAVLISGTGSNFKAIINASNNGKISADIALVISNNPNALGINHAKDNNIPYYIINHKDFSSRSEFESEIDMILNSQEIDLICLAGFMRILTAQFTRKYQGKIINIHPSLLPKFKGANAIKDAYNSKHKVTGCTVHYVIPEMDSGEIILQKSVEIEAKDSLEDLKQKIHKIEHIAYIEAINKVL